MLIFGMSVLIKLQVVVAVYISGKSLVIWFISYFWLVNMFLVLISCLFSF